MWVISLLLYANSVKASREKHTVKNGDTREAFNK